MKIKYENTEEDFKAIQVINNNEIKNLTNLEKIFKANLLPLRERYVFYFIGKQHSLNLDYEKWGTDECPFRSYKLKSDFWERYLQYYRSQIIKISMDNNNLLKSKISDNFKNPEQIKIHPLFIKNGYNHKEKIDLYLSEMVKVDIDDPNADWSGCSKGIFPTHYYSSLDRMDNELDPPDSIKYDFDNKIKSSYIEPEWCPACHEAPCMCSDPF